MTCTDFTWQSLQMGGHLTFMVEDTCVSIKHAEEKCINLKVRLPAPYRLLFIFFAATKHCTTVLRKSCFRVSFFRCYFVVGLWAQVAQDAYSFLTSEGADLLSRIRLTANVNKNNYTGCPEVNHPRSIAQKWALFFLSTRLINFFIWIIGHPIRI